MHAGLHTLRVQALRVETGTHGYSLDVLTKDIPITSSSLFGGDLGKAVEKATTTSRNYKALGDCFILSELSRPKLPRSRKQKGNTSLPFRGDNRSRYDQGQASQNHNRFRKRMRSSKGRGTGADQQSGKPKQPQWQCPKQGNKLKSKPRNHKGREERLQRLTRGPSHETRLKQSQRGTGAGPPAQTPLTPNLPLPSSQTPTIPQRKPSTCSGKVDTACPPSRSPTQGHLLFQGRDPGNRSPGVLLTLLGGGHPGRPLGTGDYPSWLLHRTDPTPPVPRGLEHTNPPRRTVSAIQRGGWIFYDRVQ